MCILVLTDNFFVHTTEFLKTNLKTFKHALSFKLLGARQCGKCRIMQLITIHGNWMFQVLQRLRLHEYNRFTKLSIKRFLITLAYLFPACKCCDFSLELAYLMVIQFNFVAQLARFFSVCLYLCTEHGTLVFEHLNTFMDNAQCFLCSFSMCTKLMKLLFLT